MGSLSQAQPTDSDQTLTHTKWIIDEAAGSFEPSVYFDQDTRFHITQTAYLGIIQFLAP